MSTAARLLELRVQIPLEARMFVSCDRCVLSGRDICDGPIPRPEESCRLWRVVVCDLALKRESALYRVGLLNQKQTKNIVNFFSLQWSVNSTMCEHIMFCLGKVRHRGGHEGPE